VSKLEVAGGVHSTYHFVYTIFNDDLKSEEARMLQTDISSLPANIHGLAQTML
jgi:hypothetical protein